MALLSSRLHAAEPAPEVSEPNDADRAQPANDELEPPEAIETTIEYPDGERSAAEVVVELTVDRRGAVTEAHVVQGEPPFSDYVLRAAPSWRFTPARRAGKAVPARFRWRVEFEPP
ncbi:MAG TPA: TonB family protein, partial [Polyangiaceae bacterium]|nr:TonB family protein [Polyangiaceae bacterium]